jgi:hypothetical protein
MNKIQTTRSARWRALRRLAVLIAVGLGCVTALSAVSVIATAHYGLPSARG